MRTLTICIFSMFICGCAQTLPVDIWIGSNFEQEEAHAVLRAFDRWEQATGRQIVIYRGRHIDAHYDSWNMTDDRHVVYKLENPTSTTELFEDWACWRNGYKELAGFAFQGDILIYWYNLEDNYAINPESEYYDIAHSFFLWSLQNLTMHETGHFLGLGHNDDPDSIMNPHRRHHWPEEDRISDRDVDDFCRLYDCP